MGWPGCAEHTRLDPGGEAHDFRHNWNRIDCAAAGTVSVTTLAAGLKNKPPEGVKLDGTEWQLDPTTATIRVKPSIARARKAQQADTGPRTSARRHLWP